MLLDNNDVLYGLYGFFKPILLTINYLHIDREEEDLTVLYLRKKKEKS